MDFEYTVLPTLVVFIGFVIAWLASRRLLSLWQRDLSDSRKALEAVLLSSILVIALAIAGSSGFNAIELHRFRTHEMPGTIYQVSGHAMRIDCTGTGSPTLVLDAGLGNDGLIWGGVQPILSQTTRVCSYDRAGFGWSDPLSSPRDADHIAAELHGLLDAAHINGPIVLMGHSIAGIYIRDYASRYPQQVAGLIFVDGSTPLQQNNAALRAADSKGPPLWIQNLVSRTVFAVGIPRLFGACSRTFPGFDAHASHLQAEDRCHPQLSAIQAELDSFDRSGEETVHTGPYGALPILIFSQDPSQDSDRVVASAWNQMQEDLKQLSSHSRRIIARGSPHYIQLMRADLIRKEVPLFIDQIRGTAPQPTSYGTTVTE